MTSLQTSYEFTFVLVIGYILHNTEIYAKHHIAHITRLGPDFRIGSWRKMVVESQVRRRPSQ